MLIFRNIIITILLLLLAAISVVGIMVEAPPVLHWTPDRINDLGRSVLTIMRPGMLLFLVWWLVLLATMFVFFITVVRPRKRMKIEVQMGGGRVVIMDAAIKKYIRNALSELGEVTVKKIDLREHRNLVTTDITADVRTKENLPILERRIISRVRAALAEDLGITNLGDVHVLIRNFEVSGRSITPSSAKDNKSDLTPEKSDSSEKIVAPASDSSAYEPPAVSAAPAALADPVDTSDAAAQPIIFKDTDNDPDKNDLDKDETRFARLDRDASTAGTASDVESPAVTKTSDAEPINIGEKAIAQDDNQDSAHHDDLDEPLPWAFPDSAKKDTDETNDDDNKGFRPL